MIDRSITPPLAQDMRMHELLWHGCLDCSWRTPPPAIAPPVTRATRAAPRRRAGAAGLRQLAARRWAEKRGGGGKTAGQSLAQLDSNWFICFTLSCSEFTRTSRRSHQTWLLPCLPHLPCKPPSSACRYAGRRQLPYCLQRRAPPLPWARRRCRPTALWPSQSPWSRVRAQRAPTCQLQPASQHNGQAVLAVDTM